MSALDVLSDFFNRLQPRPEYWPAELGNPDGVVVVPDEPGWIYVRMTSGEVIKVYNGGRVPEVFGQKVMVGYEPANPKLMRAIDVRHVYGEALAYASLVGHAYSHMWLHPDGGNDVVFIDARQFMALRVAPAGGNTVKIYFSPTQISSGWKMVSEVVDLNSYIPTTPGNALWVLLALNALGVVSVTAGVEVAGRYNLDESYIPQLSSGRRPLAAIVLEEGQTQVTESRTQQDILDLRFSYPINIGDESLEQVWLFGR